MANIDSDYSFDSSSEEEETTKNVDNGDTEGPRRKSARLDSSPQRQNKKRKRASIPTDLQELAQIKKQVSNQLRGHDIDENLSLRIIKAAVEMQETHLRLKQKRGQSKGDTVPAPRIAITICQMFGISNLTYSKIISSFFSEDCRKRVIYTSGKDGTGRTGNRKEKDTRIPRTTECRLLVHKFVREKRANRERVTARQVVDCLVENGMLSIPRDEHSGSYRKKDFDSAYRTVRRMMETFGFQRGNRTGNLIMKEDVILKKHHYLINFVANRNLPPDQRLREVMLDASYIHEHYHRLNDSPWDPNDEQDVQISQGPVKGRQYCFCAALQGPDPRVAVGHGEVALAEMAGLVPGSVWRFCPQTKGDHVGDYDKVFHGDNFLNWWTTQLLPNLHQPSLIMLDNAKHHFVYDKDVPAVHKMKKAELQAFLAAKEVHVDPHATALQLRNTAREWIRLNEKPAVVKVAEASGHRVLFTPPYHSDLEPIKLVWALIKGNIGRQQNKHTNLDIVLQRLDEQFAKLDEQENRMAIHKMIEECSALALRMYEEIQNEDEEDDYEKDDNDEDEQIDPWQQQDEESNSDNDDGSGELVAV